MSSHSTYGNNVKLLVCIQLEYNASMCYSWANSLWIIRKVSPNTAGFFFFPTYYTEEPESTHVPPFLQRTWTHGVTPHWPTLRPKAGCPAGCPSAWNFVSLLVLNCTSKMHPLKEREKKRTEGHFHFSERKQHSSVKCDWSESCFPPEEDQ